MIRAGLKNLKILTAAQGSLNAGKAVRRELENCNGSVQAVISRKDHSGCSDCICATIFVENFQKRKTAKSRQGNANLGKRDRYRSGDYEESTERRLLPPPREA